MFIAARHCLFLLSCYRRKPWNIQNAWIISRGSRRWWKRKWLTWSPRHKWWIKLSLQHRSALMILSKFTVFYQMPRWCAGKWNKFVVAIGSGGYSTNVFTGRSNPLPFYIPFFTKKVPLLYSFYWQMVPLWHTLFRTLHLLTAVNAPSFK